MRPFTGITAVTAILLRNNVDTDAIIPSREITAVSKTGLAAGLFAGWRYSDQDRRVPDPAFVLNNPAFEHAEVLLAGENFGCGSSREYAVWALAEYGFRVVIAASFNPIFFRNCVRNGLVPAQLRLTELQEIARWVAEDPQTHRLAVDLGSRTIAAGDGRFWRFQIAGHARDALLQGLDAIDETLQMFDAIAAFRDADRQKRPWIYATTPRDESSPAERRSIE